jgi:outer membrane lipoprotein SlyB
MKLIKIGAILLGLAVLSPVTGETVNLSITTAAEASQAQRSRQCASRATRYADRNFYRNTAGGALLGAGVGSAVGGNRNVSRNATRGALIGGGAGMLRSNSQWSALYNRYYRNCMRG